MGERKLRAIVALGGVVAMVGCSGVDVTSRPIDDELGSQTEALTTLPSNWDPVCGDVSASRSPKTLYVATNGSDAAAGTQAAPLSTLNGAQAKILAAGDLATRDYVVVVRGGEYRGQTVQWSAFAPGAHIHIKAMAGERPVFNGAFAGETTTRLRHFLELEPPSATTNTNVTVEGLTVTHYVQVGFQLRGQCNRLYNNKIREIGDAFGNCLAPVSGSSHYIINGPGPGCADGSHPGECCPTEDPVAAGSGCWCIGFGAIDSMGGSHSLIKHNDIVDFKSAHDAGKLHAFYIAADGGGNASTDNRVEDNYVRGCDGNGVKVKRGSSHNKFLNNYFERVNFSCFMDIDTPASIHNSVTGNVCTFWYEHRLSTSLSSPAGTTSLTAGSQNFYFGTVSGTHGIGEVGAPDTDQATGRYFQPINNPSNTSSTSLDEIVTASTTADIDGDGKPEVFVALYYPTLNYTKVVYSDGGKPDLRTVAYTNVGWKVNALTKIRPFGATKDQVVGAFYLALTDETQVWVGAPTTDGRYQLTWGAKLLDSSGASGWKVNALTAGKFGADSADVLVTAAVVNGVQQIWRGDGHTAQSGSSIPGVALSSVYSNSSWRVTAMTNGAISGSTNSLITAFQWVASSSQINRIYTGDGVGGATSVQILPDTTKMVTALAVGRLGASTPRLVSSFDAAGTGQVYVWSGTTIGASAIYSNQFWAITSLATGAVDATSNDQLITSIDQVGRTEVRWADGTTGITNGGTLYAFP
ncbi:MAG: right-handed parallel beta-helix repeat-containing protein [Myxococcales bacterium]|nr:MAG: right-handed parallel beta-helix repeat-containing protein [Myxococcales bacterium]